MALHVHPLNDLVEHELEGTDCICGPDIEYIDPETGAVYASGPIVIHHSLDGRETLEVGDGQVC